MHWSAVILLGLLAPPTGCILVCYAGHNLVREPIDRANEYKSSHRFKEEARLAWRDARRRPGPRTYSPASKDGFKEGYADHLQNGGQPVPPGVPPPRDRSHPRTFTPEGHAAACDYSTGFKFGAELACSTGRREFPTVPVLLPGEPPPEPPIVLVRPLARPRPPVPIPVGVSVWPAALHASVASTTPLPPMPGVTVPVVVLAGGVLLPGPIPESPFDAAPSALPPVVGPPAALPPVVEPPPPPASRPE